MMPRGGRTFFVNTMEKSREKEIYSVTLWGGAVNLFLVALKFAAGILGASAAMVADAVHSLSDLLTDFIVLVFVKISSKPADEDHNYGHGKFETLATIIVGGSLLVVGGMLLADGIEKIIAALRGEMLPVPGWIAFAAAVVSIIAKEIIFRLSVRVGRRTGSDAVIANAWHHRSDALSSVGTGLGIGGALLLGEKWAVLDPAAAAVVSILIIVTAVKLLHPAVNQLMEKSLPAAEEDFIRAAVAEDTELHELHHLRTRRVGSIVSIEMHVRMEGGTSLNVSHRHSVVLEKKLRDHFGPDTLINIHVEPIKVNGEYV